MARAVSGAFQGDENYPGEAMISHMAQLARAGAAIVTCQEQTMAFDRAADRFFAIGDCNQVGNIHTCTRGAFSAVMQF